MSRRLAATTIPQYSESQRLEAEARSYVKVRQAYVQEAADRAHLHLSIMEAQAIDQTADSFSQGSFPGFCAKVDREIADFARKNPDKVRHSVLEDWMNEAMNDQEKARREIAGWMDNPKIAYFDTETTGFFDEGHVPVNIAACGHEDNKLCFIQIAPLNEKGESISITEGASKANHLTDAMLAGYQPLEEAEWAIRELEMLAEGGYLLTGYNTKFDRDMMCRALDYAIARLGIVTQPIDHSPDDIHLTERIQALRTYFKDPSHWLETKDVFCRAVGEEPYPGPGKYLKLEDIARRTNALTADETQAHGALADCQLLARIVRNIRKETEDMAPKQPKAAPVEKTEPEQQEWPESAKEYTTQLETSLSDLQAQYEVLSTDHEGKKAECDILRHRITELEDQCERYAQSDGTRKHHEAGDVTWSDIEINGFQFNFTRREGITVEQSIEAIMDHIRIMQALKANEKVVTLRVGLKGDWKPLKGFDKPANGKPASDEQPTDERPATPKNTPAVANKPNVPPPAKPANAPAPQSGQPAQQPTGQTTGAKKSQQCDRIVRHQIDGQNSYDLPFTLSNGKPADRPFAPSKKDTGALEKALLAAGYDLNSFELGTEYDLPILVEWTVGNQIPNSNPTKYYRDNMTFSITVNEPF